MPGLTYLSPKRDMYVTVRRKKRKQKQKKKHLVLYHVTLVPADRQRQSPQQ
jgi:hypothetical protein